VLGPAKPLASNSGDSPSSGAPEPAQVIRNDDFTADPLTNGWRLFGSPDLFRWDSTNQNLAVTWDSSKPNSYLQWPLNTLLTRHDDFSGSLDLLLEDIRAGVDPAKPGTFQIAFGFQNSAEAGQTNFVRGTGADSPDLVEFNFFPDIGYGPTVWPAVFGTNGLLNYSGSSDFRIYDLPTGEWMHIDLAFTATNQQASLSITTNGMLVGPVAAARLSTNFTAFKVDTFAIASYSDAGQGPVMPGSILAHGFIDNIIVKTPPPPVRDFVGVFESGTWTASFLSLASWSYSVESSVDLRHWTAGASPISGTGELLKISIPSPPSKTQFFRINATLQE
jgi:hypothetical protein